MSELKKTLLLFLTIITSYNAFAQGATESKELIQKLSWNSFYFITNYGTSLILNEDSQKLISLGKKHSEELLSEIKSPKKAVIIHMILTNIWEPEVFFWETYYNEDCKNEGWSFSEYSLNNLSWSEANNKLTVNPYDVKRIYKYWKNRIK